MGGEGEGKGGFRAREGMVSEGIGEGVFAEEVGVGGSGEVGRD